MTVQSTKTKERYKGNGVTRVFPIPFAYSETEALTLLYTDAKGKDTLVTSNYTVTKNSSGNTSIIYPVSGEPIAKGTMLTVYRNTPLTQIISLMEGGAFNPEVLEAHGFDRIVMMIQEQQEEIDRSIKLPISSTQTPDDLLKEIFDNLNQAVQASLDAKKALALATKQANIATTSADISTDQAQKASKALEQALDAIKNITGFANATHAFHGITLDENMSLLWVKGEEGETFSAKDFLFSAILPTEAKFFLDNGELFVELPFTQ